MYIFKLQRLRERVCVNIYIHTCAYIYIYIYYKLEEGAFLSKRFLLSDDFGFLVSSMLDN